LCYVTTVEEICLADQRRAALLHSIS